MKPKITLDTNCIIDLEEDRLAAPRLRELISLHQAGTISLRVVGISASERQPAGGSAASIAPFLEKLERVGLAGVEVLKPMAYLGITYWDWCILAGDAMVDLERNIHAVLFPQSEFGYRDYCKLRGLDQEARPMDGTWRNRKCDVLALWSHVHYSGDIFTTGDRNFLGDKRVHLEALGAKRIATPEATLRAVIEDKPRGDVA